MAETKNYLAKVDLSLMPPGVNMFQRPRKVKKGSVIGPEEIGAKDALYMLRHGYIAETDAPVGDPPEETVKSEMAEMASANIAPATPLPAPAVTLQKSPSAPAPAPERTPPATIVADKPS